jgi:hypothetical protein
MNELFQSLHYWLINLHANEAQLLGTIVGAVVTLIAAFIAVITAFKQIAKQFEHKVIYEGWTDFQSKLFEFSTALTNYDSTVQWLVYFVKSQHNPLVNGGNLSTYRQNKWQEVITQYTELQKAYVNFLRSYENHEVIFIPLNAMYKSFIKEYRKRVEDKQMTLMEQIFPEMYGKSQALSDKVLIKKINDYWYQSSEISAFLDDFRRELQNVTVGKILGREIPKRIPHDKKYRILTKKGFVFQKWSFRDLLSTAIKRLKRRKVIGKKVSSNIVH